MPALNDQAILSEGFNPTGTITFTLFGPGDPTCTGPPVFTSTKPVSGNDTYVSDVATPPAPGTYRWIAAYSGDINNLPVTTACGDPEETVTVAGSDVAPQLTLTPSPSVPLGGQITASATLSGGNNPTGTITFRVYGPGNSVGCFGPALFSNTQPVSGNGTYTSDPLTPGIEGRYWWVAVYSGDANNAPITTNCTDQG